MKWIEFLEKEKTNDYFNKLITLTEEAYQNRTCYPPKEDILKALDLTEIDDIKVVILGQDPYHEYGQANGLAFSTNAKKLPPSLINIYKEMSSDLNLEVNQDGDLSYLARQGVLLLNSTLTVEEGKANSHVSFGSNILTDNIIKMINKIDRPIVFILWGNFAIKKASFLSNPKHLILKSPHPSPLSAYQGFFGSRPFSKTNDFLIKNNIDPIIWVKREYEKCE